MGTVSELKVGGNGGPSAAYTNGVADGQVARTEGNSLTLYLQVGIDDYANGFRPGIAILAKSLAGLATVPVVAPERDHSGASNSLTLDRPLSVRESANGFRFVNGTPTDCVPLAVTGLLEEMPDMIISGINLGANMGDDTIYSGTVAAATEGYLLGIPSLAISLASKAGKHYATAARVTPGLVERVPRQPPPAPVLLQTNGPPIPPRGPEGFQMTRLGKRHKA